MLTRPTTIRSSEPNSATLHQTQGDSALGVALAMTRARTLCGPGSRTRSGATAWRVGVWENLLLGVNVGGPRGSYDRSLAPAVDCPRAP